MGALTGVIERSALPCAELSEIAGLLCFARNAKLVKGRRLVPHPIEVEEEECPLPEDRAADGAAESIPVCRRQRLPGLLREEVVGIENLIAQVIVRAAMKFDWCPSE